MTMPIFLTLNLIAATAMAQSSMQSAPQPMQLPVIESVADTRVISKKITADLKKFDLKIKDIDLRTPARTDKISKKSGPGEGGGGNVSKSTRADLEEVVNTIGRHIDDISDRKLVGREIRVTNQPLKRELEDITISILGIPYFTVNEKIVDHLKGLKFEIIDGPCFHGSEEKDASILSQKSSTICLSASRLSRFPKAALKQTLLPLLFHEVAHQFGFDEPEANAFQELASLHLTYRTIYLSAIRARFVCSFASNSLSDSQKRETLESLEKVWGTVYSTWPSSEDRNRSFSFATCAVRANSTGENLERLYDGSVWNLIETVTLTPRERQLLLTYSEQNEFTFATMIEALQEPSIASTCDVCKTDQVDPALLSMLGAKVALELIDREVGRFQEQIQVN